MEKSKGSFIKKLVIALLVILLLIPLAYLAWFEYWLVSGEYTDAADITSVYGVNNDKDYVVLKTSEGTLPDSSSSALVPEPYSRNVEQGVMVKYDHEFLGYLTNELGCRELDRLGGLGFYETKGGKKFTLQLDAYEGGNFCLFPYAVEQICGVTMDEIVEDSNK